jgi:hypothetical protein
MSTYLRLLPLLLAFGALAGCHSQSPLTREALVGNYKYVSEDPATKASDHDLDRLVLSADGTYDLMEGGATRPVSEKRGFWRIQLGTPSDHTDVVLDSAGFPVEISKNEIRLVVDQDTGVWWLKTN